MQLPPTEYQRNATSVTATLGTYGQPSVKHYTMTPSFLTLMTPYPFYKYLHNNIGWASLLPEGLRCTLER
jgi:hypothetical protein